MIDKPIKDLTPEEREQVIQEMKDVATPEEWDSITQLAKWIGDAGAWLRMANYHAAASKFTDTDNITSFFTAMREFLPILIEELEKDPEIANLNPIDMASNQKFREIVDRAADRAANIETKSLVEAQQEGRDKRRLIKEKAIEQNAIMELRSGGNMPFFSQRELWDAFAPGRISKLGTINPDAIDAKTGMLMLDKIDAGDIMPLNAADISYSTFLLLNTIQANSVENYREYFIADGAIKFYVKGVLDSINVDPRIKSDAQLNLDRKTAGVLYLEKIFEPFLGYIGTTDNGSRYSVLNYEGYDAASDTITIRTPYLFNLWQSTQQRYSERKRNRQERITDGKAPLKKDRVPLEVNSLFKLPAYKEDDAVLEIAAYITNVMITAGGSSKVKKTEISYKKLIKECSRLNEKLTEISSRPNAEQLPDGKIRNNAALYNTELRKIAKAFNLILDPAKCDATNRFDFVDIQPAKINKAGQIEFIAPTKKKLSEKITILWTTKPEID